MAIPLNTVISWLTAEGITAQINANWLSNEPDELVVVTGAGGTTVSFDGLFEGTHVHIRCRATTDGAAEAIALQVHGLLSPINRGGSVQMGNAHVLSITPLAPPSFLMRDVDQRVTYMATYLLTGTTVAA